MKTSKDTNRHTDETLPRVSVSVLGATGSVGRAALQVIAQSNFQAVALCAHKDLEGLVALCKRHRPRFAALREARLFEPLRRALQGSGIACGAGESAVLEAASMESEATVAAISGIDGLAPTLEAARRKTKVVLANKECVVAGGAWFLDFCARQHSPVVPADSEHNAIFQILEREKRFDDSSETRILGAQDGALESIVLTASGGPFLDRSHEELARVTRREACAHPNFRMGEKISIDSATMMNKALEVIEAARLFVLEESAIDIVVQPQQIVHGMVVYGEGSVFALAGACDMRLPLWHALHWPHRRTAPKNTPPNATQRLDWRTVSNLVFRPLDCERFPAPNLARESLTHAAAPIVLNAANEVIVDAFVQERIAFHEIVPFVQAVMQMFDASTLDHPDSLERILTIDGYGRRLAYERLARRAVSRSLASPLLSQSPAASLLQA